MRVVVAVVLSGAGGGVGGKERENRLSVWLNSKIAFSPSGSASTDVSFRPPWQGHSKKCSNPDTIQPLCVLERSSAHCLLLVVPPPTPTPTPPPHVSAPLLMLAGGTIGEGLAQSWGGVAGQQNGL